MAEKSPSRALAQRKRSSATATVVVIVVVVVVGALGGWFLFLRGGPEQTASEFLAAAAAGDLNRLKLTLTEDSLTHLKARQVEAVVQQIVTQFRLERPVYIPDETTTQGVGAVVKFKGSDPARPEAQLRPVTVVLEKQGGKWRVQLLRTIKETFGFDLGGSVSDYLRTHPKEAPPPPSEGESPQ